MLLQPIRSLITLTLPIPTPGYVNHPDASPDLAFPLWDYFLFARHSPAIMLS